ncbi:hypothetical protein KP509_16G067900 [Ceratopteris richardii]|uniref:Uncharacterized protein n=1 Tax=Ceratopteris richardii TaxID=49495 RepID=A0A8T2T397_CERRI|nr:hypothetical protein KP509_16G067900 [Ceratopteris richardii]
MEVTILVVLTLSLAIRFIAYDACVMTKSTTNLKGLTVGPSFCTSKLTFFYSSSSVTEGTVLRAVVLQPNGYGIDTCGTDTNCSKSGSGSMAQLRKTRGRR